MFESKQHWLFHCMDKRFHRCKSSHVWKDMRMSKWWQNFHFWVIYSFPITEYLRYKAALLMWIKRWHAWHKQMCLKGHVGYFMAFFSKDSSWVPGEGCIEVFPQTHPDVWACFPNDAEQMAFKRLSTWLSLTYKRQSWFFCCLKIMLLISRFIFLT